MTSPTLIYASTELELPDNTIAKKFQHIRDTGIYYEAFVPAPRSGTGPNPWNVGIMENHRIPTLTHLWTCTFEETTDLRAQQLSQSLKQNNKPILVFWSGGIDSTVALCGMIRNFDDELMNRVIVKMTASSYIENPTFFENHIRNKIKYNNDPVVYGDYNIIDGAMADPLWIQRDIINMDMWRPGIIKHDAIRQPDNLISWLTNKCGKEHALWFYELVVENSISAGMELIDYEDFYWWWNFNNCYAGQHYKSIEYVNIDNIERINLEQYFANVIPWFSGELYQKWSLSNRSNGVKYQGTIRSYKMPAKNYIFSVDQNPWYKDYKTKTASTGYTYKNPILGIYSDGKILINRAIKN
jgi:hypothetical protein